MAMAVAQQQSTATEDRPPHSSLVSQNQEQDDALGTAESAAASGENGNGQDAATKSSAPAPASASLASSVQVVVRVRPMLPHETGSTSCIQIRSSSDTEPPNVVCIGGQEGPKFTFDHGFDSRSTQIDVFSSRVQPLVDNCLEGYNATCLAYGQTGSGKTHTIMGPSSSTGVVQDEVHQGVIPRAIRTIFATLQSWKDDRGNLMQHDTTAPRRLFPDNGDGDTNDDPSNDDDPVNNAANNTNKISNSNQDSDSNRGDDDGVTPNFDYQVKIQFLEVYGEEIRDLLATTKQTKLTIRDVGMEEPEVLGATQHPVHSADEALVCMTRGMLRRVTGATAMNETSSRSHAILSLLIEQSTVVQDADKADEIEDTMGTPNEKIQHVQTKRSKFNFVDLAGSERQKRTQASGQRLKEGIDINKGLLVLGNVISALGDPNRVGKTFVPYRDSKLTRLLKGSLGGNHKTLMIACVSPSDMNMEETLNCLRYANRAKNIQNHAIVNVDATTRLVQELKGKLQNLARDVLRVRKGEGDYQISVEALEGLARGEEVSLGNVSAPNGDLAPPSRHASSAVPSSRNIPNMAASDAEEKICALEAEKEIYRIQLDALYARTKGGSGSEPSATDGNETEISDLFKKRVVEYEREISDLKKNVRNLQGMRYQPSPDLSIRSNLTVSSDIRAHTSVPILPPKTPAGGGDLKKAILMKHRSESPELSRLKAQMHNSMSQSGQIEAEVTAAEEAEVSLANKYLQNDDDDGTSTPPQDLEAMEQLQNHQQMEFDLYELSSSILAKEELIEKLQASQDKYEAMREFYETRLKEMGDLLQDKQLESDKLSKELKQIGTDHEQSRTIQTKLREKQSQIAELKKKQKDLTKLTSVVSKNQSQIAHLRKDVVDMKHKKVQLQKQITEERKNHMQELNRMKKASIQKDREMSKLKKQSESNAHEAEKSKKMAKARMEQVSQLRARNKEVEKKLRLSTLKKGVLRTAGFDSVITGRMERTATKNASSTTSATSTSTRKGRGSSGGEPDANALREFFDEKVSIVSKRESLAEKLANEWEHHLELSTKKSELLEFNDGTDIAEEVKSIESQISSKKERIRQLASRLGKPVVEDDNRAEQNSFLFDSKFKEICKSDPLSATRTAVKVAFGMVVRERRRVTKLARMASKLDDRVQEAQAAAKSTDTAFRAFTREKEEEISALVQTQQEQILSLMEIVQDPSSSGASSTEQTGGASTDSGFNASAVGNGDAQSYATSFSSNPKLLILANERIAILERQVEILKRGKQLLHSESSFLKQDMATIQEHNATEQSNLLEENKRMKSALNGILAELKNFDTGKHNGGKQSAKDKKSKRSTKAALEHLALNALRNPTSSQAKGSIVSKNGNKVPKKTIVVDSFETDEDEDEEEDPAWAAEIMADLAIIAQGKMPVSLMNDEAAKSVAASVAKGSNVFDRLSDPKRYTGVQKRRIAEKSTHRGTTSVSSPERKRASSPTTATGNNNVDNSYLFSTSSSSMDQDSQRSTHSAAYGDGTPTPPRKTSATRIVASPVSRNSSMSDVEEGHEATTKQRRNSKDKKETRAKRKGNGKLSVFERLTKTTTQAYAPKQHKNIAEEMLDDILDDTPNDSDEETKPTHVAPEFARVDEYAKQNVFERLTKTTTQSYATKKNKNIAADMLDHILDKDESSAHAEDDTRSFNNVQNNNSGFARVDEYAKQNVFDRLTKTTTQAYAVKAHKGDHDQSHGAGSE